MTLRTGVLAAAALFAVAGPAAPQTQWPTAPLREGTLAFDARATVGDFTGTTTTLTGRMTGGPALADVRGWVEAPVRTLVTGNDRRDRDLNQSMESDRHPTMRFELEGVTVVRRENDSTLVTLAGRLTLHGVTRNVTLPARVVPEGAAVRVRTEFPLDVRDHGIGGLTRAFGLLRMQPVITVRVDVVFEPTAGPAAAAVPPAPAPAGTRPGSAGRFPG